MLNCFFIGVALYCGNTGPAIATFTEQPSYYSDGSEIALIKRGREIKRGVPAARSTLPPPRIVCNGVPYWTLDKCGSR